MGKPRVTQYPPSNQRPSKAEKRAEAAGVECMGGQASGGARAASANARDRPSDYFEALRSEL
jgi:hypothetical protein